MTDVESLIGHFNRIEAGVWFDASLGLPLLISSKNPRQRVFVYGASLGFACFGITDLLEAGAQGTMPLWLWGLKMFCGLLLLVCRLGYMGWRNFRMTDPWFLFGLFCLVISITLILMR